MRVAIESNTKVRQCTVGVCGRQWSWAGISYWVMMIIYVLQVLLAIFELMEKLVPALTVPSTTSISHAHVYVTVYESHCQ